MGFEKFRGGIEVPEEKNEDKENLEEAYEETKRRAMEFNKKSEDLTRRRQEEEKKKKEEEEEKDRLRKEKEEKEEGGMGDFQGGIFVEKIRNSKDNGIEKEADTLDNPARENADSINEGMRNKEEGRKMSDAKED